MKYVVIPILSLVLTALVIGNAYIQKKQFYPTVLHITKSNPCMIVIYLQWVLLVVGIVKCACKIFFGQLRSLEREHISERGWFVATETCLAFTVIKSDITPKFVVTFTALLVLKLFHWLIEERIDFMERTPVVSLMFHVRTLSTFFILGALDLTFVTLAYQSIMYRGISSQIVFGVEYAILLTTICSLIIKYLLHVDEIRRQIPWEHKIVFLLYTNLVICFIKTVLYSFFVYVLLHLFTVPFFAFRPMFHTVKDLKKAFKDIVMSRRAIRNMNTLYPDATPEDLSSFDNVCIICREEVTVGSPSKKLPCSHIFHTSCLRSWFQRQQTCPTCRLNVLLEPTNVRQNSRPNRVPQENPPESSTPLVSSETRRPNASQEGEVGSPQTVHPSVINISLNIPTPQTSHEGLFEDELRRIETAAAENLDAKIQYLQNVKHFLDTTLILLQQYQAAKLNLQKTQGSQTSENNIIVSQEHTESTSAPHASTSEPSNKKNSSFPSTPEANVQQLVRQRRLETFNKTKPTGPSE